MTRAQAALLFATAAIVAIIAGIVTAIVIAGGDGGDNTTHDLSNDLTAAASAPTPAEHSILMFCEPLTSSDGRIATWFGDEDIVYAPNTCDPGVGADGTVAARSGDGSQTRVSPEYQEVRSAPLDTIIWIPALGDLDGVDVKMTGRYLRPDAEVDFDEFDRPYLILNFTEDGGVVFGSLTRRILDLPLATFLDGRPLVDGIGRILAPTVAAEIHDTIVVFGLPERAKLGD